MGVTVFSCTRVAEPVSQNEKAKAVKKAAVKKSSGKKKGTAAPKKNLKEELERKIAEEEK